MKLSNNYNKDFYETLYNKENIIDQEVEKNDRLLSKLDETLFLGNKKILDVGCGVGIFGSMLIKRYKTQVYGLEISKVAIKKSRKVGLKTKEGNIDMKWPFKPVFFDLVIGNQIFEHIVNPDHFLEEARRVLKSKGVLILSTPNLAAWFNRIIFLFGYHPFFLEASTIDKTIGLGFTRRLTSNRKPLGHIRVFTTTAIRDLLNLHGFDFIKIKGTDVEYLPRFMRPLDRFFSLFPSFSSEIIIVAKKRHKQKVIIL